MRRSRSLPNGGFTLTEILVVAALLGGVAVVLGSVASNVLSYNRVFDTSLSTVDDAEKLLRPMTEEIRSATTSNTGAYPLDSMSATSFSFYSDTDDDGLKELIHYQLTGTTFIKEVTVPSGNPLVYNAASKTSKTFLTGIRNTALGTAVFSYYDGTYTGGSTGIVPANGAIEDVRMVGITLSLDKDPLKPPAPVEVQTKVSLRNLKQQ